MGPNRRENPHFSKNSGGLLPLSSGQYHFKDWTIDGPSLKIPIVLVSCFNRWDSFFKIAIPTLPNTSVYDELAFGPRQLGLAAVEIDQRVNDTLALLEIEHLRRCIPTISPEGRRASHPYRQCPHYES